MVKTFDFYSGFEGEPELLIFQRDKDGSLKACIKLWIGFFDEIMQSITTNGQGEWEGVTLYYHTVTGWYDESSWKCKDLELFIKQLQSINHDFENQQRMILDLLMEILTDAVHCKDDIFFEYY